MAALTTPNSSRNRSWQPRFLASRPVFYRGSLIIGLNLLVLGSFGLSGIIDPLPDPKPASAGALLEELPASTLAADPPPASPTLPASPTFLPSPSPTNFLPPLPDPTAAPTLPARASIEGIKGYRQSLPLSCESRSAVDWAAFFGRSIDELAFFNGLPVHENPEKGFVGSVTGSWGQIPPDSYGVHAEPVAQRLREFGLNARAVRGMTLEELEAEIAAGKPVIVWVVGHVARGTPVPFTDSEGSSTIVARFEHTVLVIGYSEDKLTVLDGARVYSRYKGEFRKSWGVLDNQAVVWID